MRARKIQFNGGYLLVQMLIFASIATLVIGSLISFSITNTKLGRRSFYREQAFQMAEAGVEYYRWHLAHARTDYTDGTGSSDPSTHNFYDKDGVLLGTYTLTITPPPVGSTLVKIKSVGVSAVDPTVKRSILYQLAVPSFAKYAFVSNSNMRFGIGTEVFGPIHLNGGARFDGLAHSLVTSAVASYNDPDHSGAVEFGVHTHINAPPATGMNDTFRPLEAPPSSVPSRTDVFVAGRQFPVPAVDFTGITANLSQMKTDAQADGHYFANSGTQGYKIVLKTNDTFDLYKVTNLTAVPNNCTNNQTGWGTWSVQTTTLVGNFANPVNGLIFVEDHVWVEGQINTARITIASARFPDDPATRTSITVNNDLLYTNYDGTDILALIAQGDMNAGMVSANVLRIDGAIIAQNGRVGRYYYESDCSPYDHRSTITLYGMVGSATRYGFAYTDDTGYEIRNIIYDTHLLYAPPPAFPLTSDQYQVLSWQEVPN